MNFYKTFFCRIIIAGFFFTNIKGLQAQTAITAVSTANNAAASSNNYTVGTNNYKWGNTGNNTEVLMNGFNAGGVPYTYASYITGAVKLRRVNNAGTTGNYTLIWAEGTLSGTDITLQPQYQDDMETFFSNRIYNKGTDNLFDNVASNSNNIERLDWIVPSGFNSGTDASKMGFAIFERGNTAGHDAFVIAAITSLDASGNPNGYSNIVRVATTSYGDPGPNVTYRILKALQGNLLADATGGNQNRGGVVVSLQDLSIAANTTIYGYSLFSNDLPVSATPANLVDYNNTTYFPTNTGSSGGIDLIAITGVYIATGTLPVQFSQLAATEKNGSTQISWQVQQQQRASYYIVECNDGSGFVPVANVAASSSNAYMVTDTKTKPGTIRQYRVQLVDVDGKVTYSNTVVLNSKATPLKVRLLNNPVTTATALLQVSNNSNEAGIVRILDMYGRVLLTNKIQLVNGGQLIEAGTQNLTAGQYLLVLQAGSKQQVVTFFKQ